MVRVEPRVFVYLDKNDDGAAREASTYLPGPLKYPRRVNRGISSTRYTHLFFIFFLSRYRYTASSIYRAHPTAQLIKRVPPETHRAQTAIAALRSTTGRPGLVSIHF